MLRLSISGRRSFRSYVFLVVFVCTFVTFTLTPTSIPDPVGPGRPRKTRLPQLLFGYRQAHWSDTPPEPTPSHLEYDVPPEPTHSTPQSPPTIHTFRPDGLLQVNLDAPGRHPILDLIDRAEHDWNTKLAGASRTLPEAVREYHRRYARAPPPGFDKWQVLPRRIDDQSMSCQTSPYRLFVSDINLCCQLLCVYRWAYVIKHQVQLPDEYDQIHRDLAPFWGIEPVRLQAIQRDWESHVYSYTLAKSSPSGPFYIANEALPDGEYDRQKFLDGGRRLMALMAEVEEDLPVFRAVFNPHDNPIVFLTNQMRRRALKAGRSGDYVDIDNDPTPFTVGWHHACPIDSRVRQDPEIEIETPRGKTFIYDHLLAMDPCEHPSILAQHGQFLSYTLGPSADPYPIPYFSYCSTSLHADIRIPHLSSWVADVEGESEDSGAWEHKMDERLLWRGLNTGIHHSESKPWRASQRSRLVNIAQRIVGDVEVLVSDSEGERVRIEKLKKARLSHAMLDIAFAGSPAQCEPEVCIELEEMFEWRRRMSVEEASKYKYVIDVDGNGWSSRFKRLMTTNSLIFKSTVYPEWFTDRLAPWVHYIPIQVDYSDLYDALIFFRGDLAGQGAHEELAAKIAHAGREWSLTFWREQDIVAYFFRLFLEYARVMNEDRDELNFELGED